MKVREERPWRLRRVNKSLLDTDILSEILKGIDPTVVRNAAAYRQAFGRYSLSSVTVMEVVSGLQRNQSIRRIQKFLTDISGEEVFLFGPADGEIGRRDRRRPGACRSAHRPRRPDDRRHRHHTRPGTGNGQHRPYQRIQHSAIR